MQRKNLTIGGLLGGATSLAVIALFYLGERLAGLPFVPFDIFDWVARTLPGNVITLGIDTIVGLIGALNLGATDQIAKTIEQLMALTFPIGGGVVMGLLIIWLSSRSNRPAWQIGALFGLLAAGITVGIEFSLSRTGVGIPALLWIVLLLGGWGAVLGELLQELPPATAESQARRRAFLLKGLGGAAGVALVGWGVGSLFQRQQEETGAGQPLANLEPSPSPSSPATATPMSGPTPETAAEATDTPTPGPTPSPTPTNREQIEPAPGTRPELTPTEDFYRIDINTRSPVIQEADWTLEVAGLFDNPRPLTLSDLMAYPAMTQAVTMRCISNPIGGDLMSTANWTGLRLRDLLKDLGLRPEAQELYIEAEDGFFESVAMEDMMDPRTLLVYGMNGQTLPTEHGFPLRIYIPNRYGMKQPKWIVRIEAIDEQGPGYWVERGWSEEARPNITSVIDTIDTTAEGKIPVGGIAWAGDRGIEKVELQIDDGDWVETTLRTPPLSQLTWVQWRYDWEAAPGEHTLTVRATDGTGSLQIAEKRDVRPDGATGYHSETVTV